LDYYANHPKLLNLSMNAYGPSECKYRISVIWDGVLYDSISDFSRATGIAGTTYHKATKLGINNTKDLHNQSSRYNTYYCKLPKDNPAQVGFVLDPMLATGGSIRVAVAALKRWGVHDVRVLSVIAAPEGIHALHEEHPDVSIYVGAVDQELNDQKFIVPGLGDAGDRIFNTKR
jgi:uracil phosphoribosyltransferase